MDAMAGAELRVGLWAVLGDDASCLIACDCRRLLRRRDGEHAAGTHAVEQKGSEHRDPLTPQGFKSNHAGGVLGGISSGQDVVVHVSLKPTSSITVPGETINLAGETVDVVTTGRHDPCVGLRATPIAEAMLAIVLMDHYLRHRGQNADVVSSTPDITKTP